MGDRTACTSRAWADWEMRPTFSITQRSPTGKDQFILQIFSSPSCSAPKSPDPPPIFDDLFGDEDTVKKEPEIRITYERRAPKPDSGNDSGWIDEGPKKPDFGDLLSKPVPVLSEIVLNKKRSYAQFHLELGQSDFLLRTCATCGFKYAAGDEGDETVHKTFHKNYTHGIQFKVQDVVNMMEMELGEDWIFHKRCKAYLFIDSQRIAGCLVAEPVKKAYKVLSTSLDERAEDMTIKDARPNSTTLRFGEVIFRREVIRRAPSITNSEALESNLNGAIFCEEEGVPAVCGIRAIWVTPCNRRKRIASHLLDAARKTFVMGVVLERSQLAFSQPTSAGKALASSYTGTASFLVYKACDLN
ncbi:protein CTF7 [Actinidia rufa]|uniref:Protein CTF7 n=1 Tax=Actinidia rufa TaxID=165716 RepID=A0A7J0GDM6_9ERIC|nr:protein CTF7 [Actinidia rufa]